jgi:hypothetical protein
MPESRPLLGGVRVSNHLKTNVAPLMHLGRLPANETLRQIHPPPSDLHHPQAEKLEISRGRRAAGDRTDATRISVADDVRWIAGRRGLLLLSIGSSAD